MSETIEVPFGNNPEETATLLLAAAYELGLQVHVVATTSAGTFVVPVEVYNTAYPDSTEPEPEPEKKAPAKKTAAKKTAAKAKE